MMRAIKDLSYLLIAGLIFLITGCTAKRLIESTGISKPEIKYVSYKAERPTSDHVDVTLNFNALNPNRIGLKNVFVNYELSIDGKRFLTGSDIAIILVPDGQTSIQVPAEIVYSDIIKVLGPSALGIWRGNKSIPVVANVTIFGRPTIYNEVESGTFFAFRNSITKVIDIPIPQDKIKEIKDEAKAKLKGLF